MYAIKRIKDSLFYRNIDWVTLEKARTFKRKRDVNSFLKFNCQDFYLTSGSNIKTYGLMEKGGIITNPKDFKIVELEIKEVVD